MDSQPPSYSADSAFSLNLSVNDDVASDVNGTDTSPKLQFTIETFVTMFTTVVCVVGNSLVLRVAAVTPAFNNFNRSYLFSLTTADLFLGLFVTPFSVVCSMYGEWVYDSDIFCCVEAYLMALFIVVSGRWREREREREGGRGGEREREREGGGGEGKRCTTRTFSAAWRPTSWLSSLC